MYEEFEFHRDDQVRTTKCMSLCNIDDYKTPMCNPLLKYKLATNWQVTNTHFQFITISTSRRC